MKLARTLVILLVSTIVFCSCKKYDNERAKYAGNYAFSVREWSETGSPFDFDTTYNYLGNVTYQDDSKNYLIQINYAPDKSISFNCDPSPSRTDEERRVQYASGVRFINDHVTICESNSQFGYNWGHEIHGDKIQ